MNETIKDYHCSEKWLEKYLKARVADLGGVALKFHSATSTGYPDRVCLMPGGHTLWVELKSTGCKPTRLQQARHAQMLELGHYAVVCDSQESIDNVLATYDPIPF